MAHTPGPWKLSENMEVIAETPHGPVEIADPLKAAYGEPMAASVNIPESEACANARLIASAPELLEVCKQLVWKLSHNHEDTDYNTTKKTHPATIYRTDIVCKMAENAIAKAEGK